MSKKDTLSTNSVVERQTLRVVNETLRSLSMIQHKDAVLVGVSGGPDSVALLHIMRALSPQYGMQLAIAHLNHGLRPKESERDQAFVSALAKEVELPIHIEKKDVRGYQKKHQLSIEEAARRVRYRFYRRTAERCGYNKIALGHHADDNAEQVLMAMLRGSGLLGLAGIPPLRADHIIRPLIHLQRAEILGYLAALNLDFIMDSSNRDLRLLRNKIRYRLIPELQAEYNPKCVDSLNRLAAIVTAEETWIENQIRSIFKSPLVFAHQGGVGLSIDRLKQEPVAVQRRLVRMAIFEVKGSLRRIAFAHVDAVLKLIHQGLPAGLQDLPDGIRIRRDRDRLLVARVQRKSHDPVGDKPVAALTEYSYRLSMPGDIFIKEAGVKVRFSEIPIADVPDWRQVQKHIAFLDRDKVSFPLLIRNFRPGDRFSPLGISGHQKLKKFFIDHKISRIDRIICPIILSRNKIIYVVGHRLDNMVKIGPQTRRVLKAELLLA